MIIRVSNGLGTLWRQQCTLTRQTYDSHFAKMPPGKAAKKSRDVKNTSDNDTTTVEEYLMKFYQEKEKEMLAAIDKQISAFNEEAKIRRKEISASFDEV